MCMCVHACVWTGGSLKGKKKLTREEKPDCTYKQRETLNYNTITPGILTKF